MPFTVDALHLARAQFAFTVALHIIFPAFSIGLASYLAVLEGLWLWTKRPVFLDVYRFWLRIFAVGFAMGVVSGLVMSYQFGTNWSVFAKLAGPVAGPVMACEVLTAFFLEAGFLGVMLFGMSKVGPRLHFAASCLVAFGTLLSGFWILSVNSWMQTPAGYVVAPDGRFLPVSWLRIIFNPSVFVRFPHMILASYLSVAFVVGAWHLLRNSRNPREGAPLTLFGLPDMREERTKWAIEIPHLSSLILTHSWNGRVPGLLEFKPEDRPNSAVVFWSFRLMVGIGFAMLGLGAWSLWARCRRRLYESVWLQRVAVLMGPAGFVAILAFGFFRSLARGRELAPFLCALGWFMLSFAGLGISFYPLIVPPTVTIWDAAALRESQIFLLAGAAVMIPVIIAYSGYAYWVFRGKVQHDAGYHWDGRDG